MKKWLLASAAIAGLTAGTGAVRAEEILFNPSGDATLTNDVGTAVNVLDYDDYITDGTDTDDFADAAEILVERFTWRTRNIGDSEGDFWFIVITDQQAAGAGNNVVSAGDTFTENFEFLLERTSDGNSNQRVFMTDLDTDTDSDGTLASNTFFYMTLQASGNVVTTNSVFAQIEYTSFTFTMFFDQDGTSASDLDGVSVATWVRTASGDPLVNGGLIDEGNGVENDPPPGGGPLSGDTIAGGDNPDLDTDASGSLSWLSILDTVTAGRFARGDGTDFADLLLADLPTFKFTDSSIVLLNPDPVDFTSISCDPACALTVQGEESASGSIITTTVRVPEPATLGLLGASLVGLGAVARRRRSA